MSCEGFLCLMGAILGVSTWFACYTTMLRRELEEAARDREAYYNELVTNREVKNADAH